QSDNYNYVRTSITQVAGKTSLSDVTSSSVDEKSQSTTYVDGLGREWQTVAWKASPETDDIVQPHAYDVFGREAVKYLQYVSGTNGFEKAGLLPADDANYATGSSPQYQFYQAGGTVATDTKPYAETVFEASPLNRVVEQGAPGAAWQP